jgi:hypothetical protein
VIQRTNRLRRALEQVRNALPVQVRSLAPLSLPVVAPVGIFRRKSTDNRDATEDHARDGLILDGVERLPPISSPSTLERIGSTPATVR